MTESLERAILARLNLVHTAVGASDLAAFARYYALLQRWNQRINLTALALSDFPEASVDRLLVEPVVAAQVVENVPARWIDLGSGGGSPAIPLKVLRPRLQLTMVESRERKAAFLREAVRTLGLESARVLCQRFETLDQRQPQAELVTVRAVLVDEELVRLLGRLVSNAGSVVIFGWDGVPLRGFQLANRSMLPGGSVLARFVPE